jgi:hypothetical protein
MLHEDPSDSDFNIRIVKHICNAGNTGARGSNVGDPRAFGIGLARGGRAGGCYALGLARLYRVTRHRREHSRRDPTAGEEF